MSGGFYRIDSTRVTLREYLWGTPAALLPVAALLKLLRVRINSSTDDPNVESLAPFETDSLPPEVAALFARPLEELKAAGFDNPITHVIEDDFHHARTYLVTLAHSSGRAAARVHNRVWTAANPPRNILFVEYLTEFAGGTFLWSLSSKPDMAAPPACTVVREKGASVTVLWNLHRYNLQRRPTSTLVPVYTADDLRGLVERHHRVVRDFHVARGVFAPMGGDDIRQRDSFEADRRNAQASGIRHPEVYAEIQRLERKQTSWANTLLVLAASLGLFVAVGGGLGSATSSFSWRELLILLAVLFFHESGHYVAMRTFDYRNLRMFFIPFFGAAVSGRHYNVPGWKKAVVSLMGPLPGIVAGIVLGGIGLWTGRTLLVDTALMAVAVNGFNLIPVLPLDGGWVMHALVFSRHHLLDLLFRIVAVLALLALSVATGDTVIRILAIIMAVGLPLAYKLARVTGEIRAASLPETPSNDQAMPPQTADVIIDAVQRRFARSANNRQLAEHSLMVFETLNARPPGWPATVLLGALHVGSLAAAIVCAVVLTLGQGGLSRNFQVAANPPAHELDIGDIRNTGDLSAALEPRRTVLGTWPSVAEARRAFDDAQGRLGTGAATLFGRSLLVSLSTPDEAVAREWLASFKAQGAADPFESLPDRRATLELSCVAPDAASAAAIAEEAMEYFQAGGQSVRLIPPWLQPDERTGAERDAHRRARRTYRLVLEAPLERQDPAMKDLTRQLGEAYRRGDAAALTELQRRSVQLTTEARRRAVETLRTRTDVDQAVIERHEVIFGDGDDDATRFGTELAPLFGQLPAAAGGPTRGSAVSASGSVEHAALMVRFYYLRFGSAAQGAPAVVSWLQDRGCRHFRYEWAPGTPDEAEE